VHILQMFLRVASETITSRSPLYASGCLKVPAE
jgi:hypothetical protein